ncbi:MAG: hypothetical protein JNL72_15025 [Flavipsychrobacter sp.]|nr:hypothetical protein [Flavipsychrobacter sp.]
MQFTAAEKEKYNQLFGSIKINTPKVAEVDLSVNKINASRARYEQVAQPLGIPWYFVGITHHLEGGSNFKKHLHNGDPLTARTVQVPKGRPLSGTPPFTWEYSANDALKLQKLDKWTDWSIAGILFKLEGYNGYGYRNKGIYSPYLWSYSNHYTKGKYTADGKYDANAVSKQCGAACIIKRMYERGIIADAATGTITLVATAEATGEVVKATVASATATQEKEYKKTLAQLLTTVTYKPSLVRVDARELQKVLNQLGAKPKLIEDGKAGKNTSDAVKKATGKYLSGDPRA